MRWWWLAAKSIAAMLAVGVLFVSGFGTGAVVMREEAQRSAAEKIALARATMIVAKRETETCRHGAAQEIAREWVEATSREFEARRAEDDLAVMPPLTPCQRFAQACSSQEP